MERQKRPLSFWIAIILGVLLFFSLLSQIILFSLFFLRPVSPDRYQEYFLSGEELAKEKILCIPIHGIILSGWREDPVNSLTKKLKKALKDKEIKAIILRIDTPGGEITDCEKIYREILHFKKKKPDIPIIAFMERTAASGGYYISCACDKIFAYPTTITGSIGVVTYSLNMEELLEKLGIKMITIKSAPVKDIRSPFRAMTEEERKIIQGIVDEYYNRFVDVVVGARKKLGREEVLKLADGRIYTGKQALEYKLVDELGDFQECIELAKRLARITQARVIEYKKPFGLMDLLFGWVKSQKDSFSEELEKILLEKDTPRFFYIFTGK
jgi:protease-4